MNIPTCKAKPTAGDFYFDCSPLSLSETVCFYPLWCARVGFQFRTAPRKRDALIIIKIYIFLIYSNIVEESLITVKFVSHVTYLLNRIYHTNIIVKQPASKCMRDACFNST